MRWRNLRGSSISKCARKTVPARPTLRASLKKTMLPKYSFSTIHFYPVNSLFKRSRSHCGNVWHRISAIIFPKRFQSGVIDSEMIAIAGSAHSHHVSIIFEKVIEYRRGHPTRLHAHCLSGSPCPTSSTRPYHPRFCLRIRGRAPFVSPRLPK